MENIKIDKEFQSLIPPISTEELNQLEDNLKRDGCRDPLVLWDDTLLDGHNRLEICVRNDISYKTINIKLDSRDDAKVWIIRNQFGRRNINLSVRATLVLKLEEVIKVSNEKKMLAGKKTDPLLQRGEGWTDKTLANIAGIGHETIHRMRVINKHADEETKQKLKDNKTTIGKEYNRIKKEVPGAVKAYPIRTSSPKQRQITKRQRDEFYDSSKAIYEMTRPAWSQISVIKLKQAAERLWIAAQKYYG